MPERTCLGCSRACDKRELLRFVSIGGELTPDPLSVRSGRGAYICFNEVCFDRALKKRAFIRALRRGGDINIPEPEKLRVLIRGLQDDKKKA